MAAHPPAPAPLPPPGVSSTGPVAGAVAPSHVDLDAPWGRRLHLRCSGGTEATSLPRFPVVSGEVIVMRKYTKPVAKEVHSGTVLKTMV